MGINLGRYFIVTSGYSENGGLVSKSREALLFLKDDANLYRKASHEEVVQFQDKHPILK